MINYKNIDEYINSAPTDIKPKLVLLRETINNLIPNLTETISYGMPTFKLNGKNFVHFAYFKKHIGFYPTPTPIEKFKKELSSYKYSKGAIQFPVNEDLPINLITKIIKYRFESLK